MLPVRGGSGTGSGAASGAGAGWTCGGGDTGGDAGRAGGAVETGGVGARPPAVCRRGCGGRFGGTGGELVSALGGGPLGSAFMMLTAGIDADEGKSNFPPPDVPDVVGSAEIVGPAPMAVGGVALAGGGNAVADGARPPPQASAWTPI
jgi:hypothetical protein